MKLEIEVPENVITDAAVRAWRQSFKSPEYTSQSGGDGYEAVRGEVHKHITDEATTAAIRDSVKALAAQLTPQIVRECVTEELRRQVKRVVKAESDGQTLFNK